MSDSYPTITTSNQGQVAAVQPKPSTWFKLVAAENKTLTEQR